MLPFVVSRHSNVPTNVRYRGKAELFHNLSLGESGRAICAQNDSLFLFCYKPLMTLSATEEIAAHCSARHRDVTGTSICNVHAKSQRAINLLD
jgi:hypothetical protein